MDVIQIIQWSLAMVFQMVAMAYACSNNWSRATPFALLAIFWLISSQIKL